ncbi:hypothetical protein GW765_01620 [Candidatus Parcubacteria bacterium]|nr:hypothetical protein [Candidatus Parcubacteria bacterium]
MTVQTLREKGSKRFMNSVGAVVDCVRMIENGEFILNKDGRKLMGPEGGLIKLLGDNFQGEELKYKRFVVNASDKKYNFTDVSVEVSSKNLKVYFSCSKMYDLLAKTFPGKCLIGNPTNKLDKYRLLVGFDQFKKNNIFVSEIQFN